jgi:hypothetical protein
MRILPRSIGLAFIAFFICGHWSPIWGVASETTPAAGLTGSTSIALGVEVPIYSIGIQDNNTPNVPACVSFVGNGTLTGVQLTISDLTVATGLAPGDFTQLNLYRSTDNTFGGDILLGSNATVNVGIATTVEIDATGATNADRTVSGTPLEDFLFVTAVISPTATIGHTFRVGAVGNHVGFFEDGLLALCNAGNPAATTDGTAFTAADGDHIVIGADTPAFVSSTLAGGGMGGGIGIPFGGEPVMMVLLLCTGLYMIYRTSG